MQTWILTFAPILYMVVCCLTTGIASNRVPSVMNSHSRNVVDRRSYLPSKHNGMNTIGTGATVPAKKKKKWRPLKEHQAQLALTTAPDKLSTLMPNQRNNAGLCGVRSTENVRQARIIGGAEVSYGAAPWQADIRLFRDGQFEHICGGAIINNYLVVTAAHCVQISQQSNLRIFLGSHLLLQRDEFEHSFKVDRILAHPNFQYVKPFSNDIALVRVQANTISGIIFNNHVRPICLPSHLSSIRIEPGMRCSVSGWGQQRNDDAQSFSKVLREAVVPIMSQDDCARSNGAIQDSMLCAGFLRGGVDACHGDSGGPLTCEVENVFYLAGIVSWGDQCAARNKPGIYTRIESFIEWIENGVLELG